MVKRVARIQLPSTKLFEDLTFLAKNLYNSATYLVRQTFFKTGKILHYYSIWKQMKGKEVYLKFKILAGSHTPQQILRLVDKTWNGYKAAKKDWYSNPKKYLGMPRIPSYLPKNGKYIVIWSNQQVRVKDGQVKVIEDLMKRGFPEVPIQKLPVTKKNLTIVRLKPFYDKYILELVYEKEKSFMNKGRDQKVMGLDLGVNNLIATSDGLLVKGGVAKSINQLFNKQKAKIQAQLSKQNLKSSKKKNKLMRWRYNQLHDLLHKATRKIVRHCVKNNITKLAIGHNKNWKQKCRMGKRNNQQFVSIPFYKLIQMLKYKTEELGIVVEFISEKYTSQTCSYCGFRSKQNRKCRGLFACKNCQIVLNADINAARNIVKKAFPESPLGIRDRGCMVQPTKLTL